MGNARELANRTGDLNSALESTGRALGSANAGAGVTNSSAVSGSLSLAHSDIARALADYQAKSQIGQRQLLNQQQRQTTGLELGNANEDLAYQRDQNAGSIAGFGQLLYGAGQLGRTAPTASPIDPNGSWAGNNPSSPILGPGYVPPSPSPLGNPSIFGGEQDFGRSAGLPPTVSSPIDPTGNPLQSALQRMTQNNRKRLGGFDSRTMGDAGNGYQNGRLPALSYAA